MSHSNWKSEFATAITDRSIEAMVEILEAQTTKHAGTAPAKVKYSAIKMLQQADPQELYPQLVKLCCHVSPTAQEVGSSCLPDFYEGHADEVEKMLHRLADSHNWEVREWAAGACGKILSEHFDAYFPAVIQWTKSESENVRRAAVLAIMYAGKSQGCRGVELMLEALEMLLSDRSRYVRDNLGPFAIGDGLMKVCPSLVVQWLLRWTESQDEQVRWNVAMAFSTAAAVAAGPDARRILNILSQDERNYVKRAVAKAERNLAKRGARPAAD